MSRVGLSAATGDQFKEALETGAGVMTLTARTVAKTSRFDSVKTEVLR
jgi:hypothetical protein